jgi:hypothetical protein
MDLGKVNILIENAAVSVQIDEVLLICVFVFSYTKLQNEV